MVHTTTTDLVTALARHDDQHNTIEAVTQNSVMHHSTDTLSSLLWSVPRGTVNPCLANSILHQMLQARTSSIHSFLQTVPELEPHLLHHCPSIDSAGAVFLWVIVFAFLTYKCSLAQLVSLHTE